MAMAPATTEERKQLEESGARLLFRVSRLPAQERAAAVQEIRSKAMEMRQRSATEELARFVDRARLIYGGDVLLHTLGAQALVNLKLPLAARDLLRAVKADPAEAKAWSEHQGLLGRVNKQAFVDAQDRASPEARAALRESIKAYRAVYEANPAQYWHGINLSALLAQPEAGKAVASRKIAGKVLETVEAAPSGPGRDEWWYATRAEALLALGREEDFAGALNDFLESSPSHFALNSLHRQLCELWHLDTPHGPLGGRGLALLAVLRAAVLEQRDFQSALSVPAAAVSAARAASLEDEGTLEKTFGTFGPRRLRWWELGLKRARSVAAIYGPDGAGGHKRWGTGFVVSAKPSAGGTPQHYVLTNAHVIGEGPGMTKVSQARVRFEGLEEAKDREVAEIVWTSPIRELDATLLRLVSLPEGLEALPLTGELPVRNPAAQLFIIGHPLGDELSFSFQDNLLLDHEGQPGGRPRRPGTCLLHYRTPTEPGSSGSPVFVADEWRVVALHHAGTAAMRRLNGQDGTYEANEGIALSSIAQALAVARALDLDISA